MSRIRSVLMGAITSAAAAMTIAAVTVPSLPAVAAPPAPVLSGVTQAWDASLSDYVWRVTLEVEFQTAADTTTVFVQDATGATLSETFAYNPSFLATVSLPDSWVLPFTFRQNDGTGMSPSMSPTIQLNSHAANLVNPPWRVLTGTYVASISAVPPGITVHVSDSAGWSLDVSNSTTSIQNLQFDMPATIVEPLTAWSSFGVTNSATQAFPIRVPTTPAVTSVTGTGPWTISGTGISGHQVIVQTVSTPTITRTATIVGGAWTVSMPNTAAAPIIVYQRTLTGTTVYSDPVTLNSLPGAAAMSVAATTNTSGLQSPPRAGDPLTYTFTASNTGSSALTGVSMTPTLPGISALTYAWPGAAGSLAAGQSVTATATYALTQADVDAGVVAGSVSATSSAVSATPQSFSTSLARVPGLTTTASVDASGLSSPPQSGDVLTYTVTMTNTGNVTLSSVAAAATPAGVGPFTYAWPGTAGVLAPGQSVTATAPYAITAGDVSGGSFAATFTGSGQPPVGAPVTSAASTVTTDLAIDPPAISTVTGPDATGWDVTGTGEPGATVTITPTTGTPITALVQPDGSWMAAVPLSASGPISAVQALGVLVSFPVSAPLPGLAAPTVDPVGIPDASGWDVEGTGVPGATVTVTPTTGSPVTATVQPDGTWAAAVPLTATGPVAVTQAFGPVVSVPVSATLPPIPPTPDPTVDSVTGPDGSGWDVEGTGEPGATITVTDQNGAAVTTTVQPDGTWSAALPLTTDGPVEVTQTVGASTSDPVSAALPELGSPVVTAVLGPDAAGWDVYGTGVPGATITVTPATGAPASTTVLPDGTWVVPVPLTATGPVAAVQSFGPVVSDPMPATVPALAAPVIETVSVPDASGWDVEGTGVPGATLTVTPATGAPVTTSVQPDGSWAVAVPLTATGPVAATQAFAPVVSSADFATLPGLSAPTVDPVSAPDASGWDVEGTGVPGATVTVTPASGSPVTATVQPDGTWAAAVPLTAVGPVQVTQAVGPLASAPVSATLPPPAPAPEPTVDSVTGPDASGWDIEGTGEPGATITITDQDGTPVTTTVQPDGSWSAPLPLSTEGPVDVTQTVGASTSDPVPATLPELDPPTVDPIAVPDASGWDIEGTGEPGATVTITPASGTSVTATVQPDGSWSAQLPPTAEGPIDVVQAFGAVASDPVTVPLPAAPGPVTVTTVLGPDAAGAWLVGGAGEDGATVTVTDDTGATVTVPVTGGTWSAVLPTGTQGPLSVTQTVGPVTSAPLVVALPVSELTVGASVDSSGLSATPQPGEPLVHQFTLGNPGDTVLSGVALASSIPGLALSYSWPGAAGVLAPGQTATATATYALTQADIDARTVASTVTASGQNPAGGPVTATPATTSTPILAVASLTVSATSDVSGLSTPPHVGELVGFTFEVVNTGSTTLSSVQLASTLPGISALSYTWPGAAGVLAPGEHATVTATYPLGMADVSGFAIAAPHSVTATGLAPDSAIVTSPTVTVETGLGAPPEPAVLVLYGPDEAGAWTIGGEGMDGAVIVITDGNGTVTTTPVVDGEWSTTLPPGTVAPLTIIQRLGSVPSTDVEVSVLPTTAGDLEVAIDDDGLSPVPAVGDELELTFVVTNSGLVPLTGVAVSTTVPGLGAVTLTGWPGAPGSLAPGESVTATVDYVLTQDDLDAGRVSGLASLSGAGPAGNTVVTPTAPILQTLTSTAAAAMTVEGRIEGVLAPVAPGVTVRAGSDVHWTVTVTNTGPVTLHDVGGDTDAPQSASAALHSASAAALTAPQGFSGTLAPGASVVLSGSAPAAVGTHGIVASVTARVGTVQVAGVPVMLAGQASMFYTAAAPVTPQPGGSSGPGGLAWTGLQVSALVAVALGLAGLGTSAVLVGAARRRTRR